MYNYNNIQDWDTGHSKSKTTPEKLSIKKISWNKTKDYIIDVNRLITELMKYEKSNPQIPVYIPRKIMHKVWQLPNE